MPRLQSQAIISSRKTRLSGAYLTCVNENFSGLIVDCFTSAQILIISWQLACYVYSINGEC